MRPARQIERPTAALNFFECEEEEYRSLAKAPRSWPPRSPWSQRARSFQGPLLDRNTGLADWLFQPYDAWGESLFVFSCHPLECSVIQIAASCSVINPLITSVSPSAHRISIPQPVPGFLRAMKVGRCSNIRRICAHGAQVQASKPATIPRSADGRDRPSTAAGNAGNHFPNETIGTVGCAHRRGAA